MNYEKKISDSFANQRREISFLQHHTRILNDFSDAVIITDLKFTILSFNKAAENIYALSAPAARGKNMLKLLKYQFINSCTTSVLKTLETEKQWSGEAACVNAKGALIYLEIKLFFTYTRSGKKRGIVVVNSDITEKKSAKARIHFLDNYTHTVLNSTREAIFLLDTAGNIKNYNVYARQLMKKFTGSDLKIVGNLFEAVPKNRKAAVMKHVSNAGKGKLKEYEVKYPNDKWLEVCFFPESVSKENIHEIWCTLKDISERKKTELKIKESEKKYHSLFESMAEGMVFHSGSSKTIIFNNRAAEILGITKVMIAKSGLLDTAIKWIDRKHTPLDFAQLFYRTLKTAGAFRNKVLGIKTGEFVTWVSMNAEPVKKDKSNLIEGYVFTFTDVSPIIKSRAKLNLMQKVINEISNLVVLTDEKGKITWVNNSFVKTSGYNLKEAMNNKPGDLLKGKDKNANEIIKIRKGMYKGVPVEGEILNYTKTGKKYWVHYNIHPIRNENGQVIKFFSVQSDITQLKKMQEEMIAKRFERLKLVAEATIKGQEDKQNEIGRELHDNINQLLAASKMQLGIVIKTKNHHTEHISTAMEYIQTAIEEIRQLTHCLVAPTFRNTSLVSSLEMLLKEISPSANLNINTKKLKEDYIDPSVKLALYRIAQEQLNNINKYAQASLINLFVENDLKNIRLNIEDNGVGFDVNQQHSGIGIKNICNRAESLYGKANITSSPGNGCKLEVIIPIKNGVESPHV